MFPDRDFPVTDFGAVAGGTTDATAAFRAAIEACAARAAAASSCRPASSSPGPSTWSHVNLHVSEGATIRFSRDPAAYLPVVRTRWEGVELMGLSPLVYAYEQHDIAITGKGTLDGQADAEHWWPWKKNGHPQSQKPDRDRLFAQAEAGVPVAERVYGAGHYLRPQFIQPYRCTNVLIEGVTITNAPMWLVHPVLSRNVTVRGVTVVSSGPNNDGCDPESSTDVLIEDTLFDTGDDCIAIKSGRNADGRRLAAPSERIVVRGCRMRAGHGGVTIGSEVSGSVRDVFVERTVMSSPDLERGIRVQDERHAGRHDRERVRARRGDRRDGLGDRRRHALRGGRGRGLHPGRPQRGDRPHDRPQGGLRLLHPRARGLAGRGVTVRDSAFRGVTKGSRLEHVEDLVLRNVVLEPAQ